MQAVFGAVRDTIREHELLRPGAVVLIAVSGGMDSVVLLDILSRLSEYRLRLVVAHLNHCLRGEESDRDQQFVDDLAAAYGVPFITEAVDVHAFCLRERLSLEDGARKARYDFYERAVAKTAAEVVALGHHADDQAETVLMRLLRGSGMTGLAAMSLRRDEKYIRPLLRLRRASIACYFGAAGLRCRTDVSNFDTTFLRNRIRHEVLPYLSLLNPEFTDRLTTTARLLAADEDLLRTVTEDAYSRLVREDNLHRFALDLDGLRREKLGLRYRLYRRAIERLKGGLARISVTHVEQIDRLVFSCKPNALFPLPGGGTVIREYDRMTFSLVPPVVPFTGEVAVEGPGTFGLPGGGELVVRPVDLPVNPADYDGRSRAVIDLAAAPFPWLVRGFRPGDRFRPSGMTGTKKVKAYFIDEKVPAMLRPTIPLLFGPRELIWICGFRLSDKVVVRKRTASAVSVEVRGRPGIDPK